MTKRRWMLVFLLLLLGVGLLGIHLFGHFSKNRFSEGISSGHHSHASPPLPIPVYVAIAHEARIPLTLQAYGHMKALQSAELSFAVSGYILELDAHAGERMTQGQVIAKLDDESDRAELKSLEADLALNQATYERMLQIQKFGGISQQMIDSQKASFVKAQAQVEQQKVLISQKTLRAPFSGVLGIFTESKGAYLASGTPLISLVQQAPLFVQYTVPVDLKSELEVGQSVSVRSEAFPHQQFSGILTYIAPQVNQNSGTLTLQARVENNDYLLVPGMFVSVEQMIDKNRKCLVIPDMALMTDILGQYVFVVSHHRVSKVYVSVQDVIHGQALIANGLEPGDIVVIEGQLKLNSKDRVHILSSAPIEATHVAANL